MKVASVLSRTELKVAKEYCCGLTDKEVAERIDMRLWTVRTHKKNIYRKLSISTTHELFAYILALSLGVQWNIGQLHEKGVDYLLGEALSHNI